MKLVTAYECPDLDGVACAIAYAEFLNKGKEESAPVLFGTPHQEAQFVMKKLGIALPEEQQGDVWVLVDCSELEGLPKHVDPQKVVEIIDHRKAHQAEQFPNAKVQVELVGAAATLIAEKFYKNIEISAESASLLYLAIASNTINFKATVTTERDKIMAEWLQTQTNISQEFVQKMFAAKSKISMPIYETCAADFGTWKKQKLGIVQLEILHVQKFLQKHREELENALERLRKEESLQYIFLTLIDLAEGYNTFLVIDENTQRILSQALAVTFTKGVATRDGILMRKQIVPKVLGRLEEDIGQ